MPDEQSQDANDVFDIDRVRKLIELMKEHELTEVDLRNEARRIRLRSGGDAPQFMAMPAAAAPPASAPAAPSADSSASAPAAAEDDANITYVKSPMVGTFYDKPNPDSPTYIKVGDTVAEDTVVCLVEAMKMFNEIPAGVSGKIVAVLVDNEEPVDVNRPLFKVATG